MLFFFFVFFSFFFFFFFFFVNACGDSSVPVLLSCAQHAQVSCARERSHETSFENRKPDGQVISQFLDFNFMSTAHPSSGELRTQKLKFHLVRTQSLNVLPLKPGVGQYIAIHAALTARDFFLAYFYPSGPFTCIFPKPLDSFLCWLWLSPVPV